jgi:hypothetical protein
VRWLDCNRVEHPTHTVLVVNSLGSESERRPHVIVIRPPVSRSSRPAKNLNGSGKVVSV